MSTTIADAPLPGRNDSWLSHIVGASAPASRPGRRPESQNGPPTRAYADAGVPPCSLWLCTTSSARIFTRRMPPVKPIRLMGEFAHRDVAAILSGYKGLHV